MKRAIIILLCILHCALCISQSWTLDSCISYAQQQSYTVIRANLAVKNAEIAERSARVSMSPSINAGIGENLSFGLVEGANNVRENRTQSTTSFNASVSMPLFTGLRITNQIKRTGVELQAALADVESAKDDVELNVVSYYLQVLYYSEMQQVQQHQLQLSEQLLARTQILVAEGRQSESELYEVEAQVAQNKQQLTDAENNYRLALVDLCQLINYKDIDAFVSDFSYVSAINSEVVNFPLQKPDDIFAKAIANRPNIKAQQNRILSAELAIKEAKADYYPQLNLNASWGTGYYHMFNANNPAFGYQFLNNGSEVIGFSLSIPIYNRLQVRHAVKRQQIMLEESRVAEQELTDRLYKDIQSAYYNALAAKDKYIAAKKSREAGAKALEYATTKYELGRMSAYEYNEVQTRLYRTESELTQAKYEYILRFRILQFYVY